MGRNYSPGRKKKRNDPVLISICVLGVGVLVVLGFGIKALNTNDNAVVTGWHIVDGQTFYIDNITKQRAIGLNTINNKVYFFQPDGSVKEGWADYDGKKIYVQSNGLVATGECEIDGDIYSFAYDTYEMMTDCFVQNDSYSYYFGNDGKAVKGIYRVKGHDRYFDESGMMAISEWFKIPDDPDENNYYADKNGFLQTGWVTLEDGDHYFMDNHAAASGSQKINGISYSFNHYGMPLNSAVVFKNPDSNTVTTTVPEVTKPVTSVPVTTAPEVTTPKEPAEFKEGWREVDGRKQYIYKDGVAATGVQRIDNTLYAFETSGFLANGFITFGDKTYYAQPDGKVITSFTKIDGQSYLFDSSGRMQTGFQRVNDVPCYFDHDGKMAHGERNIDGYAYFFSYSDDGRMQTGYISIRGRNYFFDDNGRRISGWKQIASYMYYFADDGHAVSGYQTIGGERYYFDSDCSLMTETVYMNGTYYYFGSDGVIREGTHTYYDDGSCSYKEAYFDSNGRKVD